jgi:hypothetical protein
VSYFEREVDDRPATPSELLNLMELRPSWYRRAACVDERALILAMTLGYEDTNDLMVPLGRKGKSTIAEVVAAKSICARCEVVEACLDHALMRHESGIWGGTTDRERKRMRREGKA